MVKELASMEAAHSASGFMDNADASCLIQRARVSALQTAYRKYEAANARVGVPSAEKIRNLGLLDKDEDSREVMEAFRKKS